MAKASRSGLQFVVLPDKAALGGGLAVVGRDEAVTLRAQSSTCVNENLYWRGYFAQYTRGPEFVRALHFEKMIASARILPSIRIRLARYVVDDDSDRHIRLARPKEPYSLPLGLDSAAERSK
jgi:hypothetical protein